MNKAVELDYKVLDKYFSYDPITGEIRNKLSRCNNKSKVGELSTSYNKATGYYTVYFEGHTVNAHRVAYCLYHGSIDKDMFIMHGEGGKTDNSIKNLSLGTHTENMRDCKKSKNNTSGYSNVYINYTKKGEIRYSVQVYVKPVNGKKKRMCKTFKILNDAIDWRDNLKNEIGYTERSGK